jgi:hypothetical protein
VAGSSAGSYLETIVKKVTIIKKGSKPGHGGSSAGSDVSGMSNMGVSGVSGVSGASFLGGSSSAKSAAKSSHSGSKSGSKVDSKKLQDVLSGSYKSKK